MASVSIRQLIRRADVGLYTATIILLLISLAALFSFGLNSDNGSMSLLVRQGVFAAGGLVVAFLLAKLDYRFWAGMHWVLYILGVVALIAVLFFGRTIHGTTGWFAIGTFELQPVELMKVIMAIVMAKVMADHLTATNRWRLILQSGAVMAGPVVLVLLQPDFGSAAMLVAMWVVMIVVLPIRPRNLLILIGGFIALAVIAWVALLRPYQKDRIMSFISPNQDTQDAGYNVRQAVAAIGSGKIFGRGLGLGPQSQLNLIPERQTDFIFASIGEELGFVGAGAVIVLFGWLFWRALKLIRQTEDSFSSLLAVGLTSIIFIQMVVNIGMNLGLVPVVGIPLPFLSYGGSALLSSLMIIGLLESIKLRQGTRMD